MQRFLVLLTLLVAASCAYAQRLTARPELPRDLATGTVSYRRVVVAEGVSREQLYDRALLWVQQHNYGRATPLLLADQVQGKIVAQGEDVIGTGGAATAVVRHTLRFQFRNGKFQYEFANFRASTFGGFENDHPPRGRRAWNRLRTNTDSEVKNWVSSLERAMLAQE